jgi:hypothetical protein
MNQIGLKYICTWKCHKETPCVAILSRQKCHFLLYFAKLKNRRAEQVLPGVTGISGMGEEVERGCRGVNIVQIL